MFAHNIFYDGAYIEVSRSKYKNTAEVLAPGKYDSGRYFIFMVGQAVTLLIYKTILTSHIATCFV